MIIPTQTPVLMQANLPEMTDRLCQAFAVGDESLYKNVQCFTDFTRAAVQQHNLFLATRCFRLAAQLHRQGNERVKSAVENVYVYAFSSLLASCADCRKRNLVQSAVPGHLHKLYVQQLQHTAC